MNEMADFIRQADAAVSGVIPSARTNVFGHAELEIATRILDPMVLLNPGKVLAQVGEPNGRT